MSSVFVVMDNQIESNEVIRIYATREEAEAFVEATQGISFAYYEVEEHPLGAPDVPFDGPIWKASWSCRRKQVGERQLVLVSDKGFVTVVPSAVPTSGGYRYHEMFYTGPSWTDLLNPVEYEDPPVWIDTFSTPRQEWWTGDLIPDAEVDSIEETMCTVRGTSKSAVEELLRATALDVKSRLPGGQQ